MLLMAFLDEKYANKEDMWFLNSGCSDVNWVSLEQITFFILCLIFKTEMKTKLNSKDLSAKKEKKANGLEEANEQNHNMHVGCSKSGLTLQTKFVIELWNQIPGAVWNRCPKTSRQGPQRRSHYFCSLFIFWGILLIASLVLFFFITFSFRLEICKLYG